jgi:Protein of unknown function (DUF1116)
MTGIITASMPVFIVENRLYGNHAYATINEGLGKVLRFGANDVSVVTRLLWLATAAAPLLGSALRASGASIYARSWTKHCAWVTRCISAISLTRHCWPVL